LCKIILDTIVECSCCTQLDIAVEATRCAHTLLESLVQLCDCDAQYLRPPFIDQLQTTFVTLQSATSASM
jgi:hypothetical protein